MPPPSLVNRRAAPAAIALLVLLAALWGWHHHRVKAHHDASPGAPTATHPTADPHGHRWSPAQAPSGSLAGRVTEAGSGRALAGAEVDVSRAGLDFGAYGRPGGAAEPAVAIADADGRYRLDHLAPGRYSAAASAAGHAPAVREPIVLAVGETKDGVDLALAPGGLVLEGTVTDLGGGPVEGVLIRALGTDEHKLRAFFRAPFATRTDASGHYALTLAAGGYSLRAWHADYRPEEHELELVAAQRHDFVLTPGGSIEGRVLVRGDDRPVAGAMVTPMAAGETGGFTFSGFGLGGAVTDDDGHFALRNLSSGAIELRAVAPGVASAEPTTVQLGIAEEVSNVVVYVDRAYTLSGTVVGKGGKPPVEGAFAGAYNLSPGAAYVASEPSAADGAFAIYGVKPGSYTLAAAIDERVPNLLAQTIKVEDHDVTGLVIELDAGVSLSGRVDPPGVAHVSLEVPRGSLGLTTILSAVGAILVNTETDASGAFTLRGVDAGSFEIVATTDDGRSGRLPVTISGSDQQGLVVHLEERARVAGVVVDDGGQPVAELTVELEAKHDDGFQLDLGRGTKATTRADGQFEIRGVSAGDYELTVRDKAGKRDFPDAKDPTAPVAVTIKGATSVTGLRLVVDSRRESLRGVVLGPDGAPVADAWVTARFQARAAARRGGADGGDDGKAAEAERRYGPREAPVLTDERGGFVIAHLRKGSYDLEAEVARGGAKGEVHDVPTGTSTTIKLAALATLVGRVDQLGKSITSYVIEVDGPSHRREQVANQDGRYRLERLEAGSYTVSITSPAGRAGGKAELVSGKDATLDLSLVTYCSVHGTAVDSATGKPAPGLVVWAETDEGSDTGAQALATLTGNGPKTDAAGAFRVDRLGVGKGSVSLLDGKALGVPAVLGNKTFTLEAGQDLDLGTIEIKRPTPPAPADAGPHG